MVAVSKFAVTLEQQVMAAFIDNKFSILQINGLGLGWI
jgi:hypothetical protein